MPAPDLVNPGVQGVEQRLPTIEPLNGETLGERQAVEAESGPARILPDLPGVVPRPEEARVLAGPDQRPFHQERRQHDAAGNPIAPGADHVDRGGIARIIVARGDLVEERPRLRVAGQDLVGRVEVVGIRMRQRPHDRHLVGPRGQERQVLAVPDARHRRVDRLELAADAVWRLGLHVERVEMTQAARQEDDDHRLRPRLESRRLDAGSAGRLGATPQREELGQAQPQQARESDLEEFAAEDPHRMAVRQLHALSLESAPHGASRPVFRRRPSRLTGSSPMLSLSQTIGGEQGRRRFENPVLVVAIGLTLSRLRHG